MPSPVLISCAFVALTGEHPWVAGAASVAYITGNIVLNGIIQRRIAERHDLGLLIDTARVGVSIPLLPPLAWAAGPGTAAWIIAVPAIIALPFLQETRRAVPFSLALTAVVLLAWQRLEPAWEVLAAPAIVLFATAAVWSYKP